MSKLHLFLVWISIVIVSTTISITLLLFYIYKVEDKYLSITNLDSFPVKVTFKNSELDLDAFDTKEIIINDTNSFDIKVTDTDNKILNDVTIAQLKRNNQLIELTITEGIDYCYFSADLNDFYKLNSSQLGKVQLFPFNQGNLLLTDLDTNNNDYIYPGKNIQNIENISKNIIGIYPIDCKQITNKEEQLQTVKLYQNYNAASQRIYFNQQKDKILNSKNVNDLKNQ